MQLTQEQRKLVDFAKLQLNNLEIEIKTINGFLGHYLSSQYPGVSNDQLQRMIDGTPEEEVELRREIPTKGIEEGEGREDESEAESKPPIAIVKE